MKLLYISMKKLLSIKDLKTIEKQDVYDAFGSTNVKVFNSSIELEKELMSKNWLNANLLMMSSGNFDGLDFDELASKNYLILFLKKYFKKLIIL